MPAPPIIPSPCIGVCELDPETGQCIGCLRTGEEIAIWGQAGDDERLVILERMKRRRELSPALARRRREMRRRRRRGKGPDVSPAEAAE